MLRVTPTTDLTRNGFSEAAIQAWLAIPKPVFFSAGIASNLATESTEQVEASHLQFGGRSVLQSYRERCGEAYNALLDQLTRETAPLDKGCHLSICIPVAAHQEANYIGRCLEGLSHQTVSPKSFEIVLLLNHPDKSRAGDPILPDASLDVIRRFRVMHPELNIEVLYAVFPQDAISIGKIRGVLTDAVVARVLARPGEFTDHIVARFDADADGVSRHYVEYLVQSFHSNSAQRLLSGPMCVTPHELNENPLLALSAALHYAALDKFLLQGREVFGRPNSATLVTRYALAGGYDHTKESFEGSDLDARIFWAARADGADLPMASNLAELTVYTSARRGLAALQHGLPFSSQWADASTKFKCDENDVARCTALLTESQIPHDLDAINTLLNRAAYDFVRFYKQPLDNATMLIGQTVAELCGVPVTISRNDQIAVDASFDITAWHRGYLLQTLATWNARVIGDTAAQFG